MRIKLLTTNEYFKRFYFQESGTGCGIEIESHSGENYFWVQIFLPLDFFDLDNIKGLHLHPLLPDSIQIKFELIGVGSIVGTEAFIFKPWVVNLDNPNLFQFFEDFQLFIPSILFYNLLERLIFIEQFDIDDFEYIRVLKDISSKTFQKFGLDRRNVPKIIKSEKLVIEKLEEIDKVEISKFYTDNWLSIEPHLEIKYFRPSINTWFRIKSEELPTDFFELRKTSNSKTVGFLRLYNKNSSFTGGVSIEYIIDKAYRKKGYATQALLALINHMKTYSYAFALEAEVKMENEFSKKVLKRLGFSEVTQLNDSDDNFYLSLLENLKQIEGEFKIREI
jgi:RimJ/RimL family protein N-acetyltransferase